ncbi:hypothetical protein QR680_013112 [Steinernema hermaphroditum]|uniref:Uncharacterized protein n=1 Tax=Steinernema hermaphroditum TaxID=289476 RepID=A0AA39M1Q4_9BILA|nr:hypothetical protein QR680_013112 [Steinernema hermaphroditum]
MTDDLLGGGRLEAPLLAPLLRAFPFSGNSDFFDDCQHMGTRRARGSERDSERSVAMVSVFKGRCTPKKTKKTKSGANRKEHLLEDCQKLVEEDSEG